VNSSGMLPCIYKGRMAQTTAVLGGFGCRFGRKFVYCTRCRRADAE
jgi:hypothetical protein